MSVAKERRRRQGNGFDLSWMYMRRLPFSMNSDTMNMRESGAGALESPR